MSKIRVGLTPVVSQDEGVGCKADLEPSENRHERDGKPPPENNYTFAVRHAIQACLCVLVG